MSSLSESSAVAAHSIIRKVLFRGAVGLAVVAFLIRRWFLNLIKTRYDPIPLPAIEDYLLEHEKTLGVRIMGAAKLEPWLAIKIWDERMGRPKLFKSRLVFWSVINTTTKDDLVLLPERPKPHPQVKVSSFIGSESIVFQEGARHRRERALLNKGFGVHLNRAAMPFMVRASERFLERILGETAENKYVELEPYIIKLTLEIIADSAFSFDLANDDISLAFALRNMINIAANPLCVLPGGVPLVRWLERKTIERVNSLIGNAIDSRLQNPQAGNQQDILNIILSCSNENDGFVKERGEQWVKDQVQLLFIAGSDTTGSTLCWAFPYLTHYPEIQKRIKKEIKQSLINKSAFDDEVARMNSLVYLEAFLKEILRLYPPLSLNRALAEGEKEFKGVDVSSDPSAMIKLFLPMLHRREEYFPDPYAFNPDRWLTPGLADNEAFSSFAFGYRMCLGKSFALLEMKTLISTVLANHTLVPRDVGQPLPCYGPHGSLYGPVGEYPIVVQRDIE